MVKRVYRKAADWRALVREYDLKHSRESKTSFCKKRGLSTTTFCKWHKEFSKEDKFIKVASPVEGRVQTGYLKLFGLNLIKVELNV